MPGGCCRRASGRLAGTPTGPRDGSEFKAFQLDAVSGQPLPKTVGGEFFFTLHYDLHAGMVGLYIVGIAGMLMLVALVSGTIVHRRIFKDFFTLRPQAARAARLARRAQRAGGDRPAVPPDDRLPAW